jgi:hypothetical protein
LSPPSPERERESFAERQRGAGAITVAAGEEIEAVIAEQRRGSGCGSLVDSGPSGAKHLSLNESKKNFSALACE